MLVLTRDKSSGKVVYSYSSPSPNPDANEPIVSPMLSQSRLTMKASTSPKNMNEITRSFSHLIENIQRKTIATDLIVDCNGLQVDFMAFFGE
jgi:hypothetical protein